jgi:hypothetical protein
VHSSRVGHLVVVLPWRGTSSSEAFELVAISSPHGKLDGEFVRLRALARAGCGAMRLQRKLRRISAALSELH